MARATWSLFILCLTFFAVFATSPSVDVVLKGTWKSTSLLAEASEYFSKKDDFWKFVEHIVPSSGPLTARQSFDMVRTICETMSLTSDQFNLLEFALSTRYYSPQVHVFNELAAAALGITHTENSTHAATVDPSRLPAAFFHVRLVNGAGGAGAGSSDIGIGTGSNGIGSNNGDAGTSDNIQETILYSVDELVRILKTNSFSSTNRRNNVSSISTTLFPFDHIYPMPNSNSNSGNKDISDSGNNNKKDSSINKKSNIIVILYGSLGSNELSQLHSGLLQVVGSVAPFTYVLRHFDREAWSIELKDSVRNTQSEKLISLQGYGVELQIKNLEYKQTDDRILKFKQEQEQEQRQQLEKLDELEELSGVMFGQLAKRHPEIKKELQAFKEHLITKQSNESSLLLFGDSDGIKKWDMRDIALQACSMILKEETAQAQLETLKNIAQNFPSWSTAITKTRIMGDEMRAEIKSNQERMEAGKNILWINGLEQELEKLTISHLYQLVRNEIELVHDLSQHMHIPSQSVAQLLHETNGAASGERTRQQRFDLFSTTEFADKHVFYLNDIENDARYAQFPQSINDMILPTHWGHMRFCRRNVFTALFIVDPTTAQGLEAMQMAMNFYHRGFPIRWGFVFLPSEELASSASTSNEQSEPQVVQLEMDGTTTTTTTTARDKPLITSVSSQLIRFLYHVRDNHGAMAAVELVHRLSSTGNPINEERIRMEFTNMFGPITASSNFELIMHKNTQLVKDIIQWSIDFFGLHLGGSVMPALYLNGLLVKSYQMPAEQLFMSHFQPEYQQVLRLIRSGVLNDQQPNTQKAIIEHYKAYKQFNPTIIAQREDMHFVPINLMTMPDLHYIMSPIDELTQKSITHLILSDLNKLSSVNMVIEALKHVEHNKNVRISVIHQGKTLSGLSKLVNKLLVAASNKPSLLADVKHFLQQLVAQGGQSMDARVVRQLEETAVQRNLITRASNTASDDDQGSSLFNALVSALGVHYQESSAFVVTNGRLIRLAQPNFKQSDFEMLAQFERDTRVDTLTTILDKISFDDVDPNTVTSVWRSNLIFSVAGFIAASRPNAHRASLDLSHFGKRVSAIQLNMDNNSSPIPVVAFINPLSTEAQKLVSYLHTLAVHFEFPTTIFLNPLMDNSEVNLKNWYRFVLEPSLTFDKQGDLQPPRAIFKQVTSRHILTLNMDVPETWLIESTFAVEDLDNINLQKSNHVEARYQLENIILTGSCIDMSNPSVPPRGLQLTLTSALVNQTKQDTLVMANYGYFQLKANPNVFTLSLLEEHADIYEIADVIVSPSSVGSDSTQSGKLLVLNRFDGPSLILKVKRRKGKETVELLGGDTGHHEKPSMWDSISNLWSSNNKEKGGDPGDKSNEGYDADDDANVIHIFSIASGHMYERLLKIMMLSVIKNTKRKPVKFWLIKNYLSPQFKYLLPQMAKHYGFKYQLVTYKWPTWLNKQTQKQRIIWAYKVLFLDVLFPRKVKKIIYVDSDQVTRADLTELWETDLHGKSLAYTPFCDSRTEMEGYRFWKSGYWSNHLRGRSYHISALYVVDIDRFRRLYHGDQLRMYYDNLSKDPNSLSNLDQDLPNYAQHAVPIHSLDSSWLWCETWCSDAEKTRAKTIDLCNNPMTKEHKLESARRIIPEWTTYDEELRAVEQQIMRTNDAKQA